MAISHRSVAIGWLLLCAQAAAGDPAPPGMLLLRNGQILEGQITEAGDYYVVTLGKTGEIRLSRKDVEAEVASLDEAYELKKHGLFGRGADPSLDLAEWCLRHGLHARCAEQLASARQIEPDNGRIVLIERRLELARQTPSPRPTKPSSPAAGLSNEQLERTIQALPRASVERFAAVVQPLLLNRCGANQCHGNNSKAEFRLLRPPAGQVASQRFTQRNLYAALAQIDQSNPDASPLVVEPQRRHGNTLTPVFDKNTLRQLEELIQWTRLTVAAPSATVPATIPQEGQPPLSQPGPVAASPAATVDSGDATAERPSSPPAGTPPAAASNPGEFSPRDPFDPEIFNRRYFKD